MNSYPLVVGSNPASDNLVLFDGIFKIPTSKGPKFENWFHVIFCFSGIPCQQKGYILRGKIKDESGMAKMSFELEVCRIPNLNVVGIRRKRLKGDAWCYKKVCEEVGRGFESGWGQKMKFFLFFSRSSDWQLWLEVQNEQKTFHLTKKNKRWRSSEKTIWSQNLRFLMKRRRFLIYFLITNMCHSIFVQIIPFFQNTFRIFDNTNTVCQV